MPSVRELIVPIVIGVMLILFNKPFAKKVISSQNMIGLKYGEKEIKVSRIIIIICGICFIFLGVFGLFLR